MKTNNLLSRRHIVKAAAIVPFSAVAGTAANSSVTVGLLGSGGCFFDIDLINGHSPPTQWAYSRWMQHRHEGSDNPVDPAGTKALVESRWDRAQDFPFPASLAEKLTWLRQAGFQGVDGWWKEMGVALVGAFA